ncbi:MAG: hypothetical protein HGA97_10020 [Chlorobiaceae bacterium]|nr:hypothetical protein [Chlorobiaceae bacterium]
MRRWSCVFVLFLVVLAGCSPSPHQVDPAKHQSPTVPAQAVSPMSSDDISTMALSSGIHSQVQHPAFGTSGRKAILDGLRPAVEGDLGQKVVLVVHTLNVQDGFAFLVGIPRATSGGKIDYSRTRYATEMEAGLLDGGEDAPIYAVLRLNGAKWEVLTFVIGPTVVAYADWWRRFGAPKAIFPSNE